MKAIITGITGMDGSHLADLLLLKHYKVVGLKRRSSQPNEDNLNSALNNNNFSIEEADITDISSLIKVLNKHKDVTEIYNLAAQSHVGTSFKSPGITWDITAKGCMNILETLVDLDMKHVKFYQASSSEMFGSAFSYIDYIRKESDAITEHGKNILKNPNITSFQDENTRFLPQSPYAIAKCAAHETVRLFRNAYNMHASCGILFNHEGERRGELFVTRKITRWFTSFINFMHCNNLTYNDIIDTEGEYIKFYKSSNIRNLVSYNEDDKTLYFSKLRLGDVSTSRDWGYAGDYVKAMYSMLQQNSPDDYVVCTGVTHTIEDFIKESFLCVNNLYKLYPNDITYNKLFLKDPELIRPAEVPYLKGSCEKANKVLNWYPSYTFENLVKRMIEKDAERLGL